MNIKDQHLYHGAALNQIAEHKQFTAINKLKIKTVSSRSAFKVNHNIAVYLKYCMKRTGRYRENKFTFNKFHLKSLSDISNAGDKLYIALVCVKERQICCLPYQYLLHMIAQRRQEKGHRESQYQILVTLSSGRSFRVYMNAPGKRKTMLGEPIIIPRNDFPNSLFK